MNRYARAKQKVQKLHFLIARQRVAMLHQPFDYVTKTFDRIMIEGLNVKSMVKNRKLSQAISDVDFGILRQFISLNIKLN